MLGRREKRSITIFVLGVFVGIAISAIVAYFSVIASFTKDNIIKITNILPTSSDSEQEESAKIHTADKRQTKQKDTLSETDPLPQEDLQPKEEIKTDVKIAEEIMSILPAEDGETDNSAAKREIRVEQWDSPINFVGYKLSRNLLIVYGIDIKNVELQSHNGEITLIVGDKKQVLQETDNYVRFPLSFFR